MINYISHKSPFKVSNFLMGYLIANRFVEMLWKLPNILQKSVESIFFMVSRYANRFVEMLWKLPNRKRVKKIHTYPLMFKG